MNSIMQTPRAMSYSTGFALSLILTFGAVWIAFGTQLQLHTLSIVLATLALMQIVVQLVFFLHITQSRERLYLLLAALAVVFLLVAGSLWIMFTLQGRMTPDAAQMQYMDMQGGL